MGGEKEDSSAAMREGKKKKAPRIVHTNKSDNMRSFLENMSAKLNHYMEVLQRG